MCVRGDAAWPPEHTSGSMRMILGPEYGQRTYHRVTSKGWARELSRPVLYLVTLSDALWQLAT